MSTDSELSIDLTDEEVRVIALGEELLINVDELAPTPAYREATPGTLHAGLIVKAATENQDSRLERLKLSVYGAYHPLLKPGIVSWRYDFTKALWIIRSQHFGLGHRPLRRPEILAPLPSGEQVAAPGLTDFEAIGMALQGLIKAIRSQPVRLLSEAETNPDYRARQD